MDITIRVNTWQVTVRPVVARYVTAQPEPEAIARRRPAGL